MDISTALAADLSNLTDALDHPGTGLESMLRAFGAAVRVAVPSFLGMTMTIVTPDAPFSFTAPEPLAAAETPMASLLLPLTLLAPVDAGSHLVLYAARAGAFVDLSADLAFAVGADLWTLALDEHLTVPDQHLGTGLPDMAAVNQAIGILIDTGRTPERARAHLHRCADQGVSIVAAAEHTIASIAQRPSGMP